MQLCPHLLFYSYVLNIFDLLATLSLVRTYGIDVEGNPIGRMLLSDTNAAVIYKVFVTAAFLFILYLFRRHRSARLGTYAVFAAYALLAVYHLLIIAGAGF